MIDGGKKKELEEDVRKSCRKQNKKIKRWTKDKTGGSNQDI